MNGSNSHNHISTQLHIKSYLVSSHLLRHRTASELVTRVRWKTHQISNLVLLPLMNKAVLGLPFWALISSPDKWKKATWFLYWRVGFLTRQEKKVISSYRHRWKVLDEILENENEGLMTMAIYIVMKYGFSPTSIRVVLLQKNLLMV